MRDIIDNQLLNIIQSDFPLIDRPFGYIGNRLEISEDEVISRLKLLKEDKIVRQISAIFDTRQMGYASSLVAAKVDAGKIDEAAMVISKHPGVSHNYQRSHEFNLWFTIAIPPDSTLGLEKSVEILSKEASLNVSRILPSLKLYKIGVMLDMVNEDGVTTEADMTDRLSVVCGPLAKEEIDYIRALQEDIPIVSRPFQELASKYDLDEHMLLIKGNKFIKNKIMRRFAAVLHHRNAGFGANLMGVWSVPEHRADEVGNQFASFKAVSHCYLRPSFHDWPYNIFTMMHGHSEEGLKLLMQEMSAESGIDKYDGLHSVREFKKTRVKYFSKELLQWESEH